MAETTGISWTDHTWNPWRGCHKISPGCAHCYMFTAQLNQQKLAKDPAFWDPNVVRRTKTWNDPQRWQKRAAATGASERVFTCSWSDFFIEEADEWRPEAWQIIRACPNLNFQILTKRPENIDARLPSDWGPGYSNVWLGVSVENPSFTWRIDALRRIPSRVHFLSLEPLLAPLPNLDLRDIEWVIVGGESGAGFRPMPHDWARQIREQCEREGIAFFFKQSAAPRTEMGTHLDGKDYKAFPG